MTHDIFVGAAVPLMVPLFFMSLAMIILASLTYYAEMTYSYSCELDSGTTIENWTPLRSSPGNEGCQTKKGCPCPGTLYYVSLDGVALSSEVFSSIPDTFWWCAVTFTTVGYGDVNPVTPLGKVIAATTMFVGIFFL